MKNLGGNLVAVLLVFAGAVLAQEAPQITVVSPVTLRPYGYPATLKVYGAQFNTRSVVNWNGNPRPTKYVSGRQLNVTLLASDMVPGTGLVTVTNPFIPVTSNSVMIPITGVGLPSYTRMPRPGHESTVSTLIPPPFDCSPFMNVAGSTGGAGGGPTIFIGNGDGSFGGLPERGIGGILGTADLTNSGLVSVIGSQHIAAAISCSNYDFIGVDKLLLTAPLAIGDFNRDGNIDIIGVNSISSVTGQNFLLLYLGDGTGHLGSPIHIGLPEGVVVTGLVVGDFNDDGKLDIAFNQFPVPTFPNPKGIAIMLGNGDGSFKPAIYLPVPPFVGMVATADVNGDGIPDLLFLNGNLQVWLGNGDGTFRMKGSYPLGVIPSSDLTVADMNGDKKLDVVTVGPKTTTSSQNFLSLLEGNGDGSFASPLLTLVPGGGPLVVGDFNNDGRLDVMGNGSGGSWYFQQKPLVYLSTLHMDFGTAGVGGHSAPQSMTATNTGSVPVSVPSVTITGPGAAEFTQTNDCTTLAARGGFCTVTVQFAPASKGTFTATLTINHAVEGTKTVNLTGTGI